MLNFPTIPAFLKTNGKMTERSLLAAGYTEKELAAAVDAGTVKRRGMRFGKKVTWYVTAA